MKTFLRRLSGGGHQLASYSCLGIPFSSVDASKLENERYGRAYQGQIQEFLIEGVQTLVQKGLLNFFGTLLLRDDHLFLNLWLGKYCFVIRGEQIIGGYPKTITFFISLALSMVAKCIVHFSKKISQLKSDIWSFQCKNFSLKQASGLIREGGPDPLNPPPGSTTAYLKHHTGYRTWLRQKNGKKFLSQNVSVWKRKCIIHGA